MVKSAFILLLVVLLALAVTPALGQDMVELPADCGVVTLEYWNPFTGPDGPFMGQMVDAFNAEHPNIQVTMTTQSEYYTQLSTSAASGTLPDIAIVHADQVATQAYRNVLRPIDAIVEAAGIDGADSRKPYGMPASSTASATRFRSTFTR